MLACEFCWDYKLCHSYHICIFIKLVLWRILLKLKIFLLDLFDYFLDFKIISLAHSIHFLYSRVPINAVTMQYSNKLSCLILGFGSLVVLPCQVLFYWCCRSRRASERRSCPPRPQRVYSILTAIRLDIITTVDMLASNKFMYPHQSLYYT